MTTVFPLGHPVEIETVSAEVVEIAERRWGRAAHLFDVNPLRFSIEVVTCERADSLEFRLVPHGFSYLGSGQGSFEVEVRRGTIQSILGSLEQLMEATIMTALTWTFFVGVHAGCVIRNGRSVLLCGDSGAGKSTLTFACGLAGWTVVSDNSLYWAEGPHDVLVSPGSGVKLRDGARALFGEKADATLEVATLAPPGPLVFLERRPGSVSARQGASAFDYLERYDSRPDRDHAQERYRALLRQGVWTLEYERVEDAVIWLESLT